MSFMKNFALLSMLVWSAAGVQAVQLEDHFDNATYDGLVDDTLWYANSSATVGTDVYQDGALNSLIINTPDGSGANGLITRNLFDFASSTRSAGVNVEIVVNSINITAGSANPDRDMNFMIFLTDAASQSDEVHFAYPSASIAYYLNVKDTNTVRLIRQFTKDDTRVGNGWRVAQRTPANLTFPLTIKIAMNQHYAVLSLNGVPFFVNSNFDAAAFESGAALRIFAENDGDGRGNVEIESITVSDLDVPLTELPVGLGVAGFAESFSSSAFDGTWDPSRFYLAGSGPWGMAGNGTAQQNAGTMQLIAPNAIFEDVLLGTTDLPFPAGDTLHVRYQVTSIDQLNNPEADGNHNLTITEGLNAYGYNQYPGASLNAALVRLGSSNIVRVIISSKARGLSFSWGERLFDSPVVVSFPLTVELRINATSYDLLLNGMSADSQNHTANFGNRLGVQLAARNQDGASRTRVVVDDFGMGINGIPDVGAPNSASHWSFYH